MTSGRSRRSITRPGSTASSTRISEWSNATAERATASAIRCSWFGLVRPARRRHTINAPRSPRRETIGRTHTERNPALVAALRNSAGRPNRSGKSWAWPRLSVNVQGANGSSIVNSYPDSGHSPTSDRPSGPCNATTAVASIGCTAIESMTTCSVCSSAAPLEIDSNARDMWSFTDSSANVAT